MIDIVAEEKPYVKIESGMDKLTNVDLISMLIGGGNAKSLEIARALYAKADCNLKKLSMFDKNKLMQVVGMGENKAKTLMAAFEFAKRTLSAKVEFACLDSATSVYNYLHPKIGYLDHEEFWVLLMNNKYSLLKAECISMGGYTETSCDIRMLMKKALLNNATVMAVAHNHPSQTTQPSKEDDKLTERIRKACELMRIYFLDHVIVTDGAYYSYREQERL